MNQFSNYSKDPSQASFYGGIYVKLDQEAFIPGDTLSGKAYLDLVNPYPGDYICLSVKGTELAKWVDREQRTRPKPDGTQEFYYVDVPREGTIDIIKQELVLYDWKSGAIVPKGQYTFPFQFQIPNGVPGSFFFRRGNAVAEIKYSVEAFLKPEKEVIPKLKHKLQICVRENPNIAGQDQTKEVKISRNLTTWCCFNQGTMSMRTAFEKTAYAPSEEARVITEVDNSKCSLAVSDVTFSLYQTIRLSAGGHGRSFSFPIKSLNLGRIEPGQKCLGADRKEASIMLPPGQEGRAKDFKEGIEDYSPDPSSVITPSTHGKLVKSDFSLNVSCSAEGCFCCDDGPPSTSLSILVYAQAPPKQPEMVPPPNWQPQQMPQANLTVIISNTPGGGTAITIQQGASNNQGMVGGQMPPQNYSQPNQAPPMNNMMTQPQGYPQQIQPQSVQVGQNQYPPQQYGEMRG